MKKTRYFFSILGITTLSSFLQAQTYPTSGLVSYWDFDEQFTSAQNVLLSPFNPGGVSWEANRAGVANDAFSVNGNQKLQILTSDAANLRTSALTISAWAKINTTTTLSYPFIARQSDDVYAVNSYCLGIVNDGANSTYYAQLKFAGDPQSTLFSVPINLSTINGVWTHYAVTYDGTTLRLYLNGVEMNFWSTGGTIHYPSNVTDPEFGSLNGGFDDLAYYSRALSPSEIKHLYNGTDIAGDVNQNGVIDGNEIAGDGNFDGDMGEGEIAGDANGNGQIDNTGEGGGGEIAGDINGNGSIDNGEIIGDVNGNGNIDLGETAGDANGNGTIDGTETSTASIVETNALQFAVFPNPTKQHLNIVNIEEDFTFTLLTLSGAEVKKGNGKGTSTIDLAEIAQGIYYLNVQTNSKNGVLKIVKQ